LGHKEVELALIAAVASNGVVGRNNKLPWHLSGDLRYFKRTTLDKPVVMGRLTYESIGRPLPGRRNIVLSRQTGLSIAGVEVVADMAQAIALAQADSSPEIMVIGGAQVYALALPSATRLYLTEVHAEVEGDAWFPHWERSGWREISRERHHNNEPDGYDYSFVVYDRT
jgi:dihydrofolate reductase